MEIFFRSISIFLFLILSPGANQLVVIGSYSGHVTHWIFGCISWICGNWATVRYFICPRTVVELSGFSTGGSQLTLTYSDDGICSHRCYQLGATRRHCTNQWRRETCWNLQHVEKVRKLTELVILSLQRRWTSGGHAARQRSRRSTQPAESAAPLDSPGDLSVNDVIILDRSVTIQQQINRLALSPVLLYVTPTLPPATHFRPRRVGFFFLQQILTGWTSPP